MINQSSKTVKTYALLNFLSIAGVIAWNYVANSIGIKGNTVGSLSAEYQNLFTPAGYAFAIWGLIFLALIAHGIYQIKKAFIDKENTAFIAQMGPYLIFANIGNALWLWCWLNEYTAASVLVMLFILVSLVMVIVKLNMERWDAPLSTIAWIWWPVCLYSGWISVATIANISAYLAKIGWQALFSEVTWTIIMIAVATLLNLWMIYSRNMREFAGVGIWALVAIAVRHWEVIPSLQWTALIGAGILFIAITIHGYQNRATNPFNKVLKSAG